MLRSLAAVWGVLGVTIFLSFAIVRLAAHMFAALEYELSAIQWLVLIVNVLFMAYSEGYKGFQKSFSPRVAARALYLSKNATWINGLLAPLFCLGYFGTTRRRQLSVLLLTVMIVVLIFFVSKLSQPWRGIVDAGVVIGLLWGLTSLLVYIGMAFIQRDYKHSPELSLNYLDGKESE